MHIEVSNIDARITFGGSMEVILRVAGESKGTVKRALEGLVGKRLSAEIKPWRKKRSLDANAYFWVLCGKIGEVLRKSKDEVYVDLICDYGVFDHLYVVSEAVDAVKQKWRACRELGEVWVDGELRACLQCYYGSSVYDTKEMSRLIDGTVQEAKELGIETLTPSELAAMKSAWGREREPKEQAS